VIIAGFLFVFSATIPFDIRDAIYDAPQQKTIPHLVGIKWSKMIAAAALLTSFFLLFSYSSQVLHNTFFLTGYTGLFLLILFTKQRNPELYFSFLIDGWIAFWGAGMYVL
jgi:4-hydroxybenzoate polyprenyltransferase